MTQTNMISPGRTHLTACIVLSAALALAACAGDTGVGKTLIAGGDCMFGRDAGGERFAVSSSAPWQGISRALEKSDAFLFNLETTIGIGGLPKAKSFVFRSPPQVLDDLKRFGQPVACLANNHSMDFGIQGLTATLEALDAAGIAHAGAGMNAGEALRPALLTIGNSAVSVFSCGVDSDDTALAADMRPEIAPINAENLRKRIDAVRGTSTVVVVMLHWGVEYETVYAPQERRLARALVDAGADLVVGSGPHVIRGIERYRGALICYSMGNLIFDDLASPETSAGILVRMRYVLSNGSVSQRGFAIAPLRTRAVSQGPGDPSLQDAEGIVAAIAARSPEPAVIERSRLSHEDGLCWFELE